MNTIDNTITTALNFNQPGENTMLKKLFDAWVDTLMYGLTSKAIEQVGFHRMFVDYICTAHSYTKKNDLDEGDAFMPFDVFRKTVQEWAAEIDGYLREFDGDTLAADTFCRLHDDDLQRAKDLAHAEGVSLTEWCRQAVRDRIAGTSTIATLQRGFAEALRDHQRDVAALDRQRHLELAGLIGLIVEHFTGKKLIATTPAAKTGSAAPDHLNGHRQNAGQVANAGSQEVRS